MALSPTRLAELYKEACELELQAFKPGNVSVYADGHDMTVADFRISAEVSAAPLCNPEYSVGEKIYYAVKATREAVACNTNLGIVLLAAPLLQAALDTNGLGLRGSLREILNTTTIADADWVFRAIALAAPGGLGEAQAQDVHAAATVSLKTAMGLASDKDRIALQYLTDYEDIFDFAILSYYNAMNIWKSKSWSAVGVYMALLSRFPDSHIERKYGGQHSDMIMQTMAKLGRELASRNPEQILPLLYQVDQELKAKRINPGTTADMTVATLLAVLLQEELI
ncbi:MAG: triphosphoribosyl-dephospho-CoA synthase [Methylovulum sp.]|uniref:triphosphoribosyl-dephospho-CoA synthase n=1 Tax=Methylovulum sp. TaxID=1916980 RepID=UPI002609C4F6|nr:triphosphoribosyl-dephospho-CoA synthase [Methylovulum sp.]MDD2724807.1 triphosphoribosyl-dephospho-CoA synthase [Methylovulum sp.]MDD5124053.1 triphosphoribosyl-dephospho-CoA synthase [Methylovulum sp.]